MNDIVKLDKTFIITLDLLNKWNAWGSFISDFEKKYHNEGVHFKDLLNVPADKNTSIFLNFIFKMIVQECCLDITLMPFFKKFLCDLSNSCLDIKYLPVDKDTSFSLSDNDLESLFVSLGKGVRFSSSGKGVRFVSLERMARIASSGNETNILTFGENDTIASTGNRVKIAASGKDVTVAACGYTTQVKTSGDDAKIVSTNILTSLLAKGSNARMAALGLGSVVILGKNGCASLAWLDENSQRYRFTVIYEGENGIKAGVPYTLDENGAVIEVKIKSKT